MTKIKHIGKRPEPDRTIADMDLGEVGYTVPWAYDADTGELNRNFTIGRRGGTCQLRIECTGIKEYTLDWTGVTIST